MIRNIFEYVLLATGALIKAVLELVLTVCEWPFESGIHFLILLVLIAAFVTIY